MMFVELLVWLIYLFFNETFYCKTGVIIKLNAYFLQLLLPKIKTWNLMNGPSLRLLKMF